MRFDIMTLFPETVRAVLDSSITGRAQSAGIIEINTYNIRDFSRDKHRRVDDTPYGGGFGMLMMPEPVVECHGAVMKTVPEGARAITLYMSPKGKLFTEEKARELAENYDDIIILCGHYEGVDRRALDLTVDEYVSVGDYVLTGGEIPACIIVDAVSRLVDGVLADPECYKNESLGFSESEGSRLLEYPQYTRPPEFRGLRVPEILLSGNHEKIDEWRRQEAIHDTARLRPDLLLHDENGENGENGEK
ncbi:MAG: tRNA (guanosine(37)-N1)-methyltransferase TrmD [Firmicutes bacterium]|nr:tRNA (guanosine(37)-N1)-methyltransferase TrmD [Bacillota bacterium]